MCSCQDWEPGANCPHVVMVWAVLKRLVSPETLSHIRFDGALLHDMGAYLGLEREGGKEPPTAQAEQKTARSVKKNLAEAQALRKTWREAKAAAAPEAAKERLYRLVIEPHPYYGGLLGRIMRGSEPVTQWATSGLPTALAHFLVRNGQYRSSRRFLEDFLKATGGRYPVVFRDGRGRETELAYRGAEPLSAALALDLRDGEVALYRTLGDGRELAAGAVADGELLFLPGAGTIHPIDNLRAWSLHREMVERLESTDDCWECEPYDDDEDLYADDGLDDGFDDDGFTDEGLTSSSVQFSTMQNDSRGPLRRR